MSAAIQRVLIYAGHHVSEGAKKVVKGPYPTSLEKDIKMFQAVSYHFKRNYELELVLGESLHTKIQSFHASQTLLVISASPSKTLDELFDEKTLEALRESIYSGLKLFTTCGSAYWAARRRFWNTDSSPKVGSLGVFSCDAVGPLFPDTRQPYGYDFEFKTVGIEYAGRRVSVLIGGGGSFITDSNRAVKPIATYSKKSLKERNLCTTFQTAITMATYGKGRAILSMVHAGTGQDEVEALTHRMDIFPGRRDDWKKIHDELSCEHERLRFVNYLLSQLEDET